ncbi:hypothetical protein V1277_001670 [Bradyrhizobium sp. AZCC 1588]|uniref:DUF992 domain-containing protein n=1 Tax=unclassified Bradyrhizobium TaxID=2631580 RepID=UPI003058E2D7
MKHAWLPPIAILVCFSVTPAPAQSVVKAGLLTCKMQAPVGSQQHMRCRFEHDDRGPPHVYSGTVNGFGLESGARGDSMGWVVFAPTTSLPRGSLRGSYVRAGGDPPVELGSGAKLIGVSQRRISLQPIASERQVALEIGRLELR